jgi:hypothetical protein
MAKKSQPLSLEDLLEAQKTMLTASNLTEEQRKRAEDQIAKLEELRQATTKSEEKQTEVVEQVKVMTRAKGDSKNVTLGDVRTELKGMRQDLKTFAGKDPKPLRKPLSLQRDDVIDVDAKEVPEQSLTAQREERASKLSNIGATLGEKAELYQKGAGKEVTMAKNTETFERFVAETKKKDELLKDATDDQIKLFERLEDTLIKLRDSDAKDSAELRKELAKIAGELETTGDTAAKSKIGGVLENTRNRARSGGRGEAGTLGDAWSALTGKQTVLKTGYEFDPRLKGDGVRRTQGNEFGKAGAMPKKGETFSMGRIAGAATIAGNFFRGKVEDYNAKNASNLGSNFLDRNFGGNRLEEDRARLGARAEALTQSRGGQTTASPMPVPAGRGRPMAIPAPTAKGSGAMNITATVVNLRGPIKMPSSGSGWNAGNAAAGAGKDWPPKAMVTATTPAPVAAAAKPEEDSGFSLPDINIGGRGKSILGRAGSGIMSAGRGVLSAGKNLLGKVPGGMLKGGIAGIAGMGLSYGGDKLKEAGYEKTGAAADIAGQAASWGGTGAMIGSVVPGVGTAIGAGVGAVAGGAYGLYKNWGSLFGGKKSENSSAAAMPTSPMVSTPTTVPAPAVMPATNSAQQLTAMPNQANNVRAQETVKAESISKQQYLQKVGTLSNNNAAAKESSGKPIVIQQPAAAPAPAAPAPAPQTFMPRGGVRSTESAMERYSNRNAHFY